MTAGVDMVPFLPFFPGLSGAVRLSDAQTAHPHHVGCLPSEQTCCVWKRFWVSEVGRRGRITVRI
jgi:hypothetical protein